MKLFTILATIMISLSTVADSTVYTIKSSQNDLNHIVFEQCTNDNCVVIGDPLGYSKDRFSYHPNFRKAGSVLQGTGQGIGVILAAGIGGLTIVGAPIGLAIGGGIVWLSNRGAKNGPVDGFSKAQLAKELNELSVKSEKSSVLLRTTDIEKFADHIVMIEDLLLKI